MTAKRIRAAGRLSVLLAVGLFLLATPVVLAQSGGGYDLTWNTVDGGGWTFSSGGAFSVGGTAGQPDAGLISGGSYTLGGGFWGGGALSNPEYIVYLPLVLRNH